MTRRVLVGALLIVAVNAAAQTPVVIRDGSTGAEKGTAAAPIRTDPTGSTTQPVSGSVTANAGTNLNTSLLVLDATFTGRMPAGASPADNESNTIAALSRMGAFNYVFDGATWDRWTGAVSQSGTWNIGTLTTITNVVHVDDNAGSLTVDGSVTANAGTNLNTSALALDATLTGRLPAGSTPATGESNAVTTTRVGTFNFIYNGATWDRWTGAITGSVTANAGTNLNTSLLQLDATGVKLNTAQGAAIGSVTGPLGQTSTTTAAPAYTNATVNPLNTTTAGALRSDVSTIAGTAPTTAGKLDVKGADGDVFVRQGTAANLNATVVGTGTFAVQGTGTLTNNNAAPGANNLGVLPARATAAAPTYTEGNQTLLSTDLTGALRVSGSSGGGVAQTQVRNTDNSWTDVGYYTGNVQAPVQDRALIQLLQQLLLMTQQAGYVKGTFGRPVASTGDALNVNVRNNDDPCKGAMKHNAAISQTATSRLAPGMGGQRIYVCFANMIMGAAEIISLTEGTGTTCGTSETAVTGSTTAANGESFLANGGRESGNGSGTVAVTNVVGDDLCLKQSTSSRVSGNITYVYAP